MVFPMMVEVPWNIFNVTCRRTVNPTPPPPQKQVPSQGVCLFTKFDVSVRVRVWPAGAWNSFREVPCSVCQMHRTPRKSAKARIRLGTYAPWKLGANSQHHFPTRRQKARKDEGTYHILPEEISGIWKKSTYPPRRNICNTEKLKCLSIWIFTILVRFWIMSIVFIRVCKIWPLAHDST